MKKLFKIIIKQNLINERLLQTILIYLGVDTITLQKTLKDIEKEIDKEMSLDE